MTLYSNCLKIDKAYQIILIELRIWDHGFTVSFQLDILLSHLRDVKQKHKDFVFSLNMKMNLKNNKENPGEPFHHLILKFLKTLLETGQDLLRLSSIAFIQV